MVMNLILNFLQSYRWTLVLWIILAPLLTNDSTQALLAKVDPPNYNFTLDKIKDFLPGSTFPISEEIKKLYGEPVLIKKNGPVEIYRLTIKHSRYEFPLFFQVKDLNIKNKIVSDEQPAALSTYQTNFRILDVYMTLPSYFLHDIFHQSIINRHGKQNQYQHKNGNSLYTWNDVGGHRHIYSGTCTITCFPLFYTVISNLYLNEEKFIPLIDFFGTGPLFGVKKMQN
jgi:hypothetical protein